MSAPIPTDWSNQAFGVETEAELRRVRCSGALDFTTAPLLLSSAGSLLRTLPDGGVLTIDLSGVTFANSALINAVVRLQNDAARRQATVRLLHPTRNSRRLFMAAGLAGLLTALESPRTSS